MNSTETILLAEELKEFCSATGIKEVEANILLQIFNKYSQDEAIKFAEFCSSYYDEDLLPNQWMDFSLQNRGIISTKQVYELFLKQNK